MENRKSLEYTCPSHGGWGMVRIGMLIPESHQLFVCPSACGRHGALGALQQGFKHRLSYLYLEESDIISGYDDAIYEAVEEVLKRLSKRPKVFLIFVSCLDDLIGTDGEAVIETLSERYADIQFRMAHMNPIANESAEPPLVSTWKNVYSLLERTETEVVAGINMLGNYVPIDEKCELFEILQMLDMKLYHIGNCETYEALRDMGNNCLNLLISSPVEKVAKFLSETQGMEALKGHVNYNIESIHATYRSLLDKLTELKVLEKEDLRRSEIQKLLQEKEAIAREAIKKAREKVGDRKIYIDYSAFHNPFSAARFFCENGFLLERVYAKEILETDEDYQWLKRETQVDMIQANKHDTVIKWKESDESISIGLEAAYISGSKHIVSIFQDEKMYGFHGICLLMQKLTEAIAQEADVKQVIHQAGLVV